MAVGHPLSALLDPADLVDSILRYRKEGDGEVESGCRIRVYKSPSGQRVRFVVCDFEKDPNQHTSFQGLSFCFYSSNDFAN